MSTLRKEGDGGYELATGGADASGPQGLDPSTQVLIYDEHDTVQAWSNRFVCGAWPNGVEILRINRLRLAVEPTISFTTGRPYNQVFNNSILRLPSGQVIKFMVIGAEFDMFRTGEPDILNFLAYYKNGNRSSIGDVLALAKSLVDKRGA